MNQQIYEKNIKAYKKRYGEDYKPIENNKYEDRLEDTKDGNKTIQIEKDDKKIYIHSKYNVIKEAQSYTEKFNNVEYGTTIFIFGFGLSYYISELYNKVKNRADVVVYEKDKELFDICIKNIDISNILANENIVIYFNIDELERINSENKKFLSSILPSYKVIYKEESFLFNEKLIELARKVKMFFNTLNAYADMWFERDIENLEYIQQCYNLADFKNAFENKPIVVVSAGPSLNKNVKLLKELQGKVCILCAFSAAKVLEKEGIKPDFLTSLDSLQYGLSKYETDIPIIICSECNGKLIKEHKSEKLLYISINILMILLKDKFIDENLEELIKYGTGTNVAYFTSRIAKFLGASTIILIGQDYSWVGENAHAEGTVHKRNEYYKEYHKGTIEKQDINGNKVYTNEVFLLFKKEMDSLNKELFKPNNIKLIQASEGGLPIEDAEVLTLKQAIDKYCINSYCNVEKIKQQKFKENKTIGYSIDNSLLKERLIKSYNELKESKNNINIAINIINDMLKEYKKSSKSINKITDLFNKIKDINKNLEKNEMYMYIISKYEHISNGYYNIEESGDELLDNILFNEKYYKDVKEVLEKTLNTMKNIIEKQGIEVN